MENENDQQKNIKSSSCKIIDANPCLTRSEIKAALKRIYATESKPVQVGSIRMRTAIALVLIIIGTSMIIGMLGYKYLAFDASMLLPSLIFLIISFIVGFLISTMNIRKIYSSMSRFKNKTTPAYRRIFATSKWQSQALVYSTLMCLILLGAQTLGLLVVNSSPASIKDNNDSITITEGIIFIEDVNLDGAFLDAGQAYMRAQVNINNTLNYYSNDLILEARSYFAGGLYHKVNKTISSAAKLNMDVRLNIHEEEDTKLSFFILHREKKLERQISSYHIPSKKEIYIVSASAKSDSKPWSLTKSVDITVKVYNDGEAIEPNKLTLVFTSPNLLFFYETEKNNDTLYQRDTWEETWEYTFTIDNLIEDEYIFVVNLKIHGESKDETQVLAS